MYAFDNVDNSGRPLSITCVVSNRAQLQKEKQLRENAEQQRQELEERLKKYQEEVERARKG